MARDRRDPLGELPVFGSAEVAQFLGWDRRKVATYLHRGRLPEPMARLACGPIWRREDIEAFAPRRRRTIQVYLRVCNNHSSGRGMSRTRRDIEDQLHFYNDVRFAEDDHHPWTFEVTFSPCTDDELERELLDLHSLMVSSAEARNCHLDTNYIEPALDKEWL